MAQKTSPYSNPRFDNRVYSLRFLEATAPGTGVSTGDLQRGYIIQEKGLDKVRHSLRFLYNPSVVTVNHQTDVANSISITPQNYRNPLDTGQWNIPLSASVGFDLFFDRTYELWDAGAPNPNDMDATTAPSQAGVRTDVDALYRMVGIYQNSVYDQDRARPPFSTSTDPIRIPKYIVNGDMGPMPLTPVQVFFGGRNSLTYKGYINQLQVRYTHFSQLMVPMRCTVEVSMNLMTQNSWESKYDDVETEEGGGD